MTQSTLFTSLLQRPAATVGRRHFLCMAGVGACLPGLVHAASGGVNTNGQGLAIQGHDPVAYFSDGKPVLGRAEFSASAMGAIYRFASAANMKAFQAEPERYLPQFGGYCAYGVAQGFKPDIDPTAFAVVDGKLYLNLSPAVQKLWLKDVPGLIQQANKRWPSLKHE